MAKKDDEIEDPALDAQVIREKIIHLLGIFPIISPTMLQGGLGPYVKPKVWRPVLEDLIAHDEVIQTQESLQMPSGRYNTYTKLSLTHVTVVHDAP